MEEAEIKKEETKPISSIVQAHEAADRLHAENERMEANIKQLQELKAFEVLGGKSEGAPQEKPVVEESPQDYVKRVMSGKL